MVYFDLDGVLRNLSPVVWGKEEPQSWHQENAQGQDLMDIIHSNLDLLTEAPKTKYCNPVLDWIVDNAKFLVIISSQPPEWREHTDEWIDDNIANYNHYFKANRPRVYYVSRPEQKMAILHPKDVLIEDYPKFNQQDYKQIFLIDYKYNRDVTGERARIHKPQQLISVLEKYM